MDDGRNSGSNRSERAEILLGKIADLLRVDTAFFLAPRTDTSAARGAETDPAELLRLFRSIGDAELRRSVLAMLKDLAAKDDAPPDGAA